MTISTSIDTDDTASANDLTAKTETLTFATGETTKTFTVQTIQDSIFEPTFRTLNYHRSKKPLK